MNESASPFKDQSVIITGGASGIGRASALRMAKAGAKVAVVDINEANIQSILAEIEHTCPGTTTLGIRTAVRVPTTRWMRWPRR